jgi:hypothetical protein
MKRNWLYKKQRSVGLKEVVAFIREAHPYLSLWDVNTLRDWIGYHMQEGFVIIVNSDGANIAGILVARPLMNPMDAFDGYTFDHEGPILYIGAVVAESMRTLRALAVAATKRFGARPYVAWQRRSDSKLQVHASQTVARRIFRNASKQPARRA